MIHQWHHVEKQNGPALCSETISYRELVKETMHSMLYAFRFYSCEQVDRARVENKRRRRRDRQFQQAYVYLRLRRGGLGTNHITTSRTGHGTQLTAFSSWLIIIIGFNGAYLNFYSFYHVYSFLPSHYYSLRAYLHCHSERDSAARARPHTCAACAWPGGGGIDITADSR